MIISHIDSRRTRARRDEGERRRPLLPLVAAGAAVALLATGAGIQALPAQAAVGDHSAATGHYLSGSLLGLDAALVASLGGEAAASAGTTPQTNANNLNVGALGLVNLTAPGGIQLPIDLGNAGVVGQYASALTDASSVGASGLTSATGDIGTGITPAPGVAPGPLHLSLAGAVSSLGLPTATLNELSQLQLTSGVTAARAAQAAPAAPTGAYSLAAVGVNFQSPTLAGIAGTVNTQVAALQSTIDGLAGPTGAVAGALNGLPIPGLLSSTVSIDSSTLPAAVAPLLTGPITDPAYPGVTIDLSTGTVTVDLGQLTALEGLAPNTELLSAPVIAELGNRITGVVGSLVTRVENALTTAVNGLAVNATTSLAGTPVITINSTIGQLRAGDTSGVTVLGAAALLPLGTVVSALATPLNAVGPAISAVGPAVLSPVANTLIPALDPVLSQVLSLTANNQSTSGGVFTETALRATVLPAASALTLNVANASVGPNALAGPPTVTGITPTSGPEAGGTTVTITGSGFTGATGVTFGGTAGTAFTVVNDTTITATTPAHTPGAVDVVVQHPLGDSAPLTFTYLAAPTITSVTPPSGPEAGGTPVTITGTGFTGTTAVTFGGTPATAFTVVNDTTITATTPAHAPGAVGVVVTAPGGQSAPGDFTFLAAPSISSVAPNSGPETGGTPVTITGTGFTGATAVTFGGTPATAVTVVNDTTITATTPAHAPGAVAVVVTAPGGTSAPGAFTFLPVTPPVITSLTPDSGPQNGGTVVTITGTGLTGATGATFGGTPGTAFTVVNDTTATVTTPAHAPGPVDVVVQDPNGDSTPLPFTFLATPTIASLTPDSGPDAGGTLVTITGTGFTGTTGVTFGGIPAAAFTVVNDTTITATTPAHVPATVGVVVTAPGGQSAPGSFTFLAPPAPVVTGITPDHGPQTGGTVVTITGTGLTGATGATFGGTPGTGFTVLNDTTATVTTPAHVPGAVGVVVQHPNGASTPVAFTFDAVAGAPVITGLAPDHGPFTGGTVVTISGTGLAGATAVTVGGTSVPFTVNANGTITITTPAHAAGAVPIVVTTPVGSTPPVSFTYDPGTTVDGVTPGSGPSTGGTTVTITGGCFTGATGVRFGTTAATSFTVVNDSTITAVSPAGTGTVDVTVVGAAACGSGTLAGGYRYIDPLLSGGAATPLSSGTGTLASTGSDTGSATMLGGVALLMLAAGALLILRRARRA